MFPDVCVMWDHMTMLHSQYNHPNSERHWLLISVLGQKLRNSNCSVDKKHPFFHDLDIWRRIIETHAIIDWSTEMSCAIKYNACLWQNCSNCPGSHIHQPSQLLYFVSNKRNQKYSSTEQYLGLLNHWQPSVFMGSGRVRGRLQWIFSSNKYIR